MRKYSLLFLLVAISQMGATDCGQVLRDPGFDLWCGNELCAWKTERGNVTRVATWHEGDAGVLLDGTDVAIEQLTPVNSDDDTCIRFDLVADVQDNAEVYFNVDVEGDGTLEMHERIPTSNWKPITYNIYIKPPYDGIRFELAKKGTGRAVLANIGAETAQGQCGGLTGLDPGPRRNGARADVASDCASGIYDGVFCQGCRDNNDCTGGAVCGVGQPLSPVFAIPMECIANASKELGETCVNSAECASGGCFNLGGRDGVCSSCYVSTSCPTDQTCGVSGHGGPLVCGADQHVVASGQPCGGDDDCASGHCNGTVRMECDDGRECHSPADCPFGAGGNALQNGACTTVGIQGGTCQ